MTSADAVAAREVRGWRAGDLTLQTAAAGTQRQAPTTAEFGTGIAQPMQARKSVQTDDRTLSPRVANIETGK